MKIAKYLSLSSLLLSSSFIITGNNISNNNKENNNTNNNETESNINKLFVEAAQSRNLDEMKNLLELGANINAPESSTISDTALTWACYKGYIEIVEFLIENKANLNILDRLGDTPIMTTIESVRYHNNYLLKIETIETLINAGADIFLKSKGNGQTALMMTIKYKDKSMFNFIKKAQDKNEELIKTLTTIILAENKVELANFIIKNPNLTDPEGNNALHIAAKYFKVLAFNIIWKCQPNLFNKLNHNNQTSVDAYPEIICQLITAEKLSLKNKPEDKNINGKQEEK